MLVLQLRASAAACRTAARLKLEVHLRRYAHNFVGGSFVPTKQHRDAGAVKEGTDAIFSKTFQCSPLTSFVTCEQLHLHATLLPSVLLPGTLQSHLGRQSSLDSSLRCSSRPLHSTRHAELAGAGRASGTLRTHGCSRELQDCSWCGAEVHVDRCNW